MALHPIASSLRAALWMGARQGDLSSAQTSACRSTPSTTSYWTGNGKALALRTSPGNPGYASSQIMIPRPMP